MSWTSSDRSGFGTNTLKKEVELIMAKTPRGATRENEPHARRIKELPLQDPIKTSSFNSGINRLSPVTPQHTRSPWQTVLGESCGNMI